LNLNPKGIDMGSVKHVATAGLLALAMMAGGAIADDESAHGPSSERREHMKQMCKDNPDKCREAMKEQADKWWARVDTNKDGMVSREEAKANAPRLARDFDQVDTDGDGQVTRAELEKAAKAHHAQRAQAGKTTTQ
jgi:hypothetical protein